MRVNSEADTEEEQTRAKDSCLIIKKYANVGAPEEEQLQLHAICSVQGFCAKNEFPNGTDLENSLSNSQSLQAWLTDGFRTFMKTQTFQSKRFWPGRLRLKSARASCTVVQR